VEVDERGVGRKPGDDEGPPGGVSGERAGVRSYLDDPSQPSEDVLAEGERSVASSGYGVDREEALAQVARLRVALESTLVLLERARRLVRYATAMVRSPACQGPKQAETVEAAVRAAQVYETSREAPARAKGGGAA